VAAGREKTLYWHTTFGVIEVIEPGTAAGVIFIGELDGSMVPVVEPSPEATDRRQGQCLSWKEVRLNLVHPKGRVTVRREFCRRG
jgi:hypothetical protein